MRDATTVCVVVRRCTRSRVLRRENETEEQHFFELVAPIGTECATSAKHGVVENPCAALAGTEIDYPTLLSIAACAAESDEGQTKR